LRRFAGVSPQPKS